MIDHLEELRGAQQVGVVLVKANLDDLLDPPRPGRHHRDALGEKDRLLHVMGDEDHGLARALPDAQQFVLHEAAGLRVERAERLVHQEDARVDREGAGDRGALLHAARELRGVAVLEPGQSDEVDEVAGAALPLVLWQAQFFGAVQHVLQHRLPGKQREMLKHDAAVGAGTGDRPVLDHDAARLDRQEPADEV